MTLRRINAHDAHAFGQWFEVLRRSEHDRDGGDEDGWLPDELRARSLDATASTYLQLFAFEVDGAIVAVAWLEVTRDDNLTSAYATLEVDPAHRRRGHGTRALEALERTAVAQGRRTLVVATKETKHEWGRSASRFFAPRHGYLVSEENVERDLEWPRPPGALDELNARWLPYAHDYEILSWRGAIDDAFVEDRAHLSSVMPVEAPHGSRPVEVEHWDAQRVRTHEHTVDAMGRDLLVSVARHRASSRLVGFSELTVSRERPGLAYQWDTLVLRTHRGHRLGGLMKVANLGQLERFNYATTRVVTFNETSNFAMINVNEQLGATTGGGYVLWVKYFK